ncbi:MAG: hypothetical protein N2C14_15395, partial [Planctomycetales bacterium]
MKLISTLRTALIVVVATLALKASLAEAEPEPERHANIVRLETIPTEILLNRRDDYRQVLVAGITESGARIDLTDQATFLPTAPLVKVSPFGVVTPLADGNTRIRIVHGKITASVSVQVRNATVAGEISFVRDVMPLLSKHGCNAGTCHGAQQGKDGFKLSLRGYDPQFDHQALTDDLAGRRFNRSAPQRSLMLLKSTGEVPHHGGVAFGFDDRSYHVLRDWIAAGVKFDPGVPRVERIELFPKLPELLAAGMTQRFAVVAHYEDGSSRDVTNETHLESNLPEVVAVHAHGKASAVRRGEAAILARYQGAYAAASVVVLGDRTG